MSDSDPKDPPRSSARSLIFGFRYGEVLVALGLASVLSLAVLPLYISARERALVASTRFTLRATAEAIESYNIDHEAYPACGIAEGEPHTYESQQIWQPEVDTVIPAGVLTANSFAPSGSGARRLVTFRLGANGHPPASLTTPVAYLDDLPADPFARTRGASFGYFAHGSGLGWILFSMGPDRDENVSPRPDAAKAPGEPRSRPTPGGPGDVSPRVAELYNINSDFPYMWQITPELSDATYDPTNGLYSSGDIIRMAGE